MGAEESPQRSVSGSSSGRTVGDGSGSNGTDVLGVQSGSKSTSGGGATADSSNKTTETSQLTEVKQWQGDGVWVRRSSIQEKHTGDSSSLSSGGTVCLSSPSPSSPRLAAVQKLLRKAPFVDRFMCNLQGQLRTVLRLLDQLPKHKCCPHTHSCISYVLKVSKVDV